MKAAREALGLTQDGLAQAVGGSKRGIQNNEALKSVPGGEVICGLVCLGINANWLLTGEGPMLLKDLAPEPKPAEINAGALSAIIRGLASAGVPPEKLGMAAIRAYQDAYDQRLITHTGIGDGGVENAA